MQLPEDKNPISVVYIYADGSKYECANVEGMIKNLASASMMLWSHSIPMKTIEWVKIEDKPLDIPMGVSQWRNHGMKWSYDKYFKIKWPKN